MFGQHTSAAITCVIDMNLCHRHWATLVNTVHICVYLCRLASLPTTYRLKHLWFRLLWYDSSLLAGILCELISPRESWLIMQLCLRY